MNMGDLQVDANLSDAVKHYHDALRLLYEAKQLNPRFMSARLNLACALFKLEQYPEAMDELEELVKLPIHKSILESCVMRYAMCFDRVALHKECTEFCDKWLKHLPESIWLQRVRAETIVDGFCIGKEEKDGTRIVERSSLEFFQSIVTQPDSRQVSDLCYLARLYEWMSYVDDAMNLLNEAEAIASNNWEIVFHRAAFQWRLNQLRDSLANALKASQIAPWRSQTWSLLEEIYTSLELKKEAEQARQRAEHIKRKRKELFDSTRDV